MASHALVRWVLRAITGGVVLLALLAAGAWLMLRPVIRDPLVADVRPPASAADARRQDAAFLARYGEINRSFSDEAAAAFKTDARHIARSAASLTEAEFEMQAARAVARADDGHSNVRGVSYGLSLNAVPIRVFGFAGGHHVVAADTANRDLLGAKLIEIEGRSPGQLTAALRAYIGGADAFRREHMPFFFVSPAALNAIGLGHAPAALDITVERADGTKLTRRLLAQGEPANGKRPRSAAAEDLWRDRWPRRWISPVPFAGDDRDWQYLRPASEVAASLRRPGDFYWSAQAGAPDRLFLQLNAVADAGSGPGLKDYLDALAARVRREAIRHVIIDLRANSGGNYELIMNFSEALPKALPPRGRIILLTSGNTFSAAIVMAARLRYMGRGRTIIVGQPMGDRERFWAEGQDFVLPNSRLLVKSTAAYHDWYNGCGLREITRCYLFNYLWDVPAGSLAPDVRVAPTFADYAAGRDTELEAALRLLDRFDGKRTTARAVPGIRGSGSVD